MRGRQFLTLVVGVSLLLVSGTGTIAAHNNVPYEPGASGSCENADGEGGSFAVHGPGDHENNFADPAEVHSAANAVVYFAESSGECGSDGGYFEVHVISAAKNVQYCYSEASDGDEGDSGHGGEPTDPVTGGAGVGEITINDGSRNYPPGHPANENDACEYNAHNDSHA